MHDTQRKVDANNFIDASAFVKEVKKAFAKYIYLIALEKQIAKLSDPVLPTENHAVIIKSLSPLIDHAINDVQHHA